MFKTRLISGIVLVIIALITIITGAELLFFTITAISLIGLSEMNKVFHIEKKLLGGVSYFACMAYYAILYFQKAEYIMLFVISYVIILMAVYVFAYPEFDSKQVMAAFFGMFYVAVMLSFVYQIRMLDYGKYIIWLAFVCSWGCDTCAYCVGMLFGKHKLAPKLSPKKSIEGAVGGVVGAALLGFVLGYIFKNQMSVYANIEFYFAGIGAIGAVISQIGDLAASGIKRNHEIKDYGNLIPGHGGILDRFDSVIFTAPIIYYLAYYFIR